jgi:hypothetical protein
MYINDVFINRSDITYNKFTPGGGRGAKTNDREKSWPSINNLLLSEAHNAHGQNELNCVFLLFCLYSTYSIALI